MRPRLVRVLRESIAQALEGACADFDRATLNNGKSRNVAMLQCRLQPCGHQPRTEATRRPAKSWMPGVAATSWVQTFKARRKVHSGRADLANPKPAGSFNLPRRPGLDPRATPSLLDKILYIRAFRTFQCHQAKNLVQSQGPGFQKSRKCFKTIYMYHEGTDSVQTICTTNVTVCTLKFVVA